MDSPIGVGKVTHAETSEEEVVENGEEERWDCRDSLFDGRNAREEEERERERSTKALYCCIMIRLDGGGGGGGGGGGER